MPQGLRFPRRTRRRPRAELPIGEGALSEHVSVVIPTRDAGPEFERVLDAIAAQRGVGSLELVIADSASCDETVAHATAAGARVLQIPADEFGHGRTRDLAVEVSSGDVVVVMVQDAVLVGRDALRNVVRELQGDRRLAAVSARHLPRADGDLYGAWILWLHQRMLSDARGRSRRLGRGTPLERRAKAEVENVCVALRRSAWEELRFRDLPFAEDLDFGLRAVAAGWTVERSSRVAVVHSHTRGAAYHLRRSVVDQQHLPELIGEKPSRPPGELHDVVAAAHEVVGIAQAASWETNAGVSLSAYLKRVAARLAEVPPTVAAPDGELAELMSLLSSTNRAAPEIVRALGDQLVGTLRWSLLQEYARVHRRVPATAARTFVAKLLATVLGSALGAAIRAAPADDALARELLAGI